MAFPYRLALDLGTNSIGWSILRLTASKGEGGKDVFRPIAIVRGGVRIFPSGRDPKSGASLAVERREARSMRRNRDRRGHRKDELVEALVTYGLFPVDLEERRGLENLDPYDLRSRGLDEGLTPYEFGRALFHLNQRRGFKSNRRTDSKDNDASVMKAAIRGVRDILDEGEFRTVGEWLADRHGSGDGVRARRVSADKGPDGYALYLDRAMIEEEFNALWDAQENLGAVDVASEAREAIHTIVFTQRPLKPVEPGRCTLEPEKSRAPKALPSVQRLRVFQEANALRVGRQPFEMRPLTRGERDIVVAELLANKHRTFTQLRKALGFGSLEKFNLETPKRKQLLGDMTGFLMSQEENFGASWRDLSTEQQDSLTETVLGEDDETTLVEMLVTDFDLTEDQGQAIANLILPSGYSNLCLDATRRVLKALEDELIVFSEAVQEAGYASHSQLQANRESGELFNELPYYGEALERHVGFGSNNPDDGPEQRYGKIANPAVHIALNELRKIVNELIGDYGHPTQIVVEVTRDLKNSPKVKADIEKAQHKQQEANEKFKEALAGIGISDPSRDDLLKMRLWVELNENVASRCCPYTGEQIGIERMFGPDSDVEIEHILPLSQTLDDSLANKTLAVRKANRDKGGQTPSQAFEHSPGDYDYEAILQRASLLPKRKAFRFGPDGIERFLREDTDFTARALNDTAYLSRLSREYLSLITPENNVWVVPGKLTGLLRKKLGLDGLLGREGIKNRDDHRHHAVDAAVIGIIDRGFLQGIARATGQGRNPDSGIERLAVTPPWDSYRESVSRMVDGIHVSHRPDHSHETGMANSTNYGLRADGIVAVRKPLDSFDSLKKIENTEFADSTLKASLVSAVKDASTPAEIRQTISAFTTKTGVRRARVLEHLDVITIPTPDAAKHRKPRESRTSNGGYVGLKGDSNYCLEIYADAKGNWRGEVITTFDAYRLVREAGGDSSVLRNPTSTQSGKPLVMRLMKNDTIRLEIDGISSDWRVCTFGKSLQLSLAPATEANVDSRNRSSDDDFTYLLKNPGPLQGYKARVITTSPAGRINDPGPPRL